jgi:MFS family permease
MFSWLRDLTTKERRTMSACFIGWAGDALDVQMFSFIIPALLVAWHITRSQAGVLTTTALMTSALGGWFTGALSDRYGRVRMLAVTIFGYAIFTFLSGFTHNFWELFACRSLQGLGFGGEWTAGAVLMGEVIRDKYRGRALGFVQSAWSLGWGTAAILYTVLFSVLSQGLAWRVMFWVGLTPALIIFWLVRNVDDSDLFHERKNEAFTEGGLFSIFDKEFRGRTIKASLLAAGANGAQYAFSAWLPTYFNTVRGLSVAGTGRFLLVLIAGSFTGYIGGAYFSDFLGRKKTFYISAVGSAIMILVYMLAPFSNNVMILLGLPFGFFAYLMFSPMGPLLTELFPTRVRGSAQGFCFNAGRCIGAIFPWLVGYLGDRIPIERAIAMLAFTAYVIVIVAMMTLPETKGQGLNSMEREKAAT